MNRSHALFVAAVLVVNSSASAQRAPTTPAGPETPSRDVEQVLEEAETNTQQPVSTVDRPVYEPLQRWKKELASRYGIHFAIENTTIYQATSGGVDPNDAMVNTLSFFGTWKVFRSDDGKDFGGFGLQAEQRADPLDGHFTDLRDDLGTLWSPNDATSDDYAKINQFWWGQRFADGRFGYLIGKIDAGSRINENRFAGSGNTQFFSQPFATNPGRSFPDNGLGFMLRAEPADWVHFHFTMSDSDAISNHSPFTTINGHWFYAGEAAFKPTIGELGKGTYRLMVYYRDIEEADEIGWSFSADQNLTDAFGVFLRYGGNDGDINSVQHIVSTGLSFLQPFDRKNDQAGIGVSYTHPTSADLRDEYSAETYYRLQLTEGIELSGSAQLIIDPSASDQDAVGVFGLRCRLLY